jgi:hypothetical protein
MTKLAEKIIKKYSESMGMTHITKEFIAIDMTSNKPVKMPKGSYEIIRFYSPKEKVIKYRGKNYLIDGNSLIQ